MDISEVDSFSGRGSEEISWLVFPMEGPELVSLNVSEAPGEIASLVTSLLTTLIFFFLFRE
jgi:hypothetical protein